MWQPPKQVQLAFYESEDLLRWNQKLQIAELEAIADQYAAGMSEYACIRNKELHCQENAERVCPGRNFVRAETWATVSQANVRMHI